LVFRVDPANGSYEVTDRAAGVAWRSNPFQPRFGEVAMRTDGRVERVALGACDVQREGQGLFLRFQPLLGRDAARLQVRLQPTREREGLEISYQADADLAVESVRLLDDAFWVTDRDGGQALVPVREGLLVPADSGLSFTHRFDTYAYEGCHMTMLGLVKQGAAALLTWSDPYVAAELRSSVTNLPAVNGAQILSPTLVLRKSAATFQLRLLGRGDHNVVARGYRKIAEQAGWRIPWEQKLKEHPARAQLFGAVNFKLWSTLDRRMNEESTREESVRVNWTFEEAARVAEHLKQDLRLDRVLFIMGGWIHRGYDNQHPDILPAAPECGGNDAFAECARRVRQLGYVFCLHDNYQDIYRDSPSWDERLIMKNADGSLIRGGHWAGGRAYLTCARTAVDLARRPQNLPAVHELTQADAYFIDTTYAAGLQECFDPQHPLTRADDLHWKQVISDDARARFGIFGSECGREWAIPYSDFFEGLTGVSGGAYHDAGLLKKLGATVVPLFELVYGDCIAMYGKYGYAPERAADYVLQHISLGRPMHHHNVPPHLYWQPTPGEPARAEPPLPTAGADPAVFVRAAGGWGAGLHPLDRFVKNTYEILSPLNELVARVGMTEHHFLTPDRQVQRTVFGTGRKAVRVVVNHGAESYVVQSDGGEVTLPGHGFLVESPSFAAFHALSWAGMRYANPVLFTVRSLDGRDLRRSRQVRVYHGFGEARIRLEGRTLTVEREAIVDPRGA
jgi:hypothetical protein